MASSGLLAGMRVLALAGVRSVHQPVRFLTTTPVQRLKEIIMTKTDKGMIFEGKYKAEPWEPYKLQNTTSGACSLCATNLEVKHTDVLILSQFLRSDGCMLPRRVTGLCKTQQKRVSKMVAMAQKAGLMPNTDRDPKTRPKWKKFNMYFDENTITLPREYRKREPQLLKYV